MVHATGVDSWRSAIDAHTDVIAHGLWIWPGGPADSSLPTVASSVIADAARARVYVHPTLQTVAGARSMLEPGLLDDPRLALALPPSVIAYLRSAEGLQARSTMLEEYATASPQPGFKALLTASIEETR